MIESIRLENFQDQADCRSYVYQSRESFLQCSCRLLPGNSYGIISDFGYGGWGLVTCIGGRGSESYKGEIYLNDESIMPRDLSQYSCFIPENIFPAINSEDNLMTPLACIEKALFVSGEPYTVSEIKDIFKLTDNRFRRPLEHVSGEIWQISAAVNFALGKEIFCYPWLNEYDIFRYQVACEVGIIDYLKKRGKIILISSSQGRVLRKLCDHTMRFHKAKFVFK